MPARLPDGPQGLGGGAMKKIEGFPSLLPLFFVCHTFPFNRRAGSLHPCLPLSCMCMPRTPIPSHPITHHMYIHAPPPPPPHPKHTHALITPPTHAHTPRPSSFTCAAPGRRFWRRWRASGSTTWRRGRSGAATPSPTAFWGAGGYYPVHSMLLPGGRCVGLLID